MKTESLLHYVLLQLKGIWHRLERRTSAQTDTHTFSNTHNTPDTRYDIRQILCCYGRWNNIRHYVLGRERTSTYGTVNSPLLFIYLFNIFLAYLLESFLSNVTEDRSIIAFSDDIIIYTAHWAVEKKQIRLQRMNNTIQTYCSLWTLRINPRKCETILIRPRLIVLPREV